MQKLTKKIVDTSEEISDGGKAKRLYKGRKYQRKALKSIVRGHSRNAGTNFANIGTKELCEKYEIKGLEFGVKLSHKERLDYLLATNSSLGRVAKIMKTENLGNNVLGIAYAARGSRGAMAHFEPDTLMINLTHKLGDSCLAHEYGHFLDFIFGKYIDRNSLASYLSGGRSLAPVANYRGCGLFRTMTNDILNDISKMECYKRWSVHPGRKYLCRRTEIFARVFEQYISWKLRTQRDVFLTKGYFESYTKNSWYLSESEFKKILPRFNNLIRLMGLYLSGKGSIIPISTDVKIAAEKIKKIK